MHPEMIAKQIIDFNKATFNNSFDAVIAWQDHCEKMVKLFVEKASLFPPDGKKVILEWMETLKRGRNDFKGAVDNSFKTVEDFFIDSANVLGSSLYSVMEKTDESVREVADKLKKASIDVMDKSIRTIATVADKAVKQTTAAKREKPVKSKSGRGRTNAVRMTVKTVQ
jgi:hypothetical protein